MSDQNKHLEKDSRKHIDKDLLRDIIRKSLTDSGPLHIPKKYLNPDYKYYWALFDKNRAGVFQTCLDYGYTHATTDDFPELLNDSSSKSKFMLTDEDNRIAVKFNTNQTHYLMKIPKDRWEMIQEIKQEDYNQKLVDMRVKIASAPIYENFRVSGSLTGEKIEKY